jgi:hypothetical protein
VGRLKAHFETNYKILRARNDSALTEIETATLRGHIQFFKAAIALGDDRPQTGDRRHPQGRAHGAP